MTDRKLERRISEMSSIDTGLLSIKKIVAEESSGSRESIPFRNSGM